MTVPVAQVLHDLRETLGGELTSKDVIDVARDPESPLHDRFEWDDEAAAEAYRAKQAHVLIRGFHAVLRSVSA